MNINEIQDLIKFVAKAGVNEVEIEKKDFKIVIKSDYMAKKKTNFKEEPTIVQQQIPVGNITAQPIAAAPSPAAPATVPPIQESAPAIKEEDSNLITVKAQMIGTFYRSPGPDKDSFVEVGSVIKPGDKLVLKTKVISWKRGICDGIAYGYVKNNLVCEAEMKITVPEILEKFLPKKRSL